MELQRFKCTQILMNDPNEKKVTLLGTIEGKEGKAIVILQSRLPQLTPTAEYKNVFNNDIYARFQATMTTTIEVQTIFPITQKHKTKYQQKTIKRVRETGIQYQQKKHLILQQQLKHLEWVNNIIDKKAEQERVLFRSDDFLLLPDLSFSPGSSKIHFLIIFTDTSLHSIRQLTDQHLSLLRSVEKSIENTLKHHSNIQRDELKMFFHYPPTFYRLHLHIVPIDEHSRLSTVHRCHQLQTVIQNIQIQPNYYQMITLNAFK